MTGLLRDELKFQGLIVTDALEMVASQRGFAKGEAAVRAAGGRRRRLAHAARPGSSIRAVVAPSDRDASPPSESIRAWPEFLRSQTKSRTRPARLVNLEAIAEVINSPEAAARAAGDRRSRRYSGEE